MSDEPRPMTILGRLEMMEDKVHFTIGYLEMMVEMFDMVNKTKIKDSIISLIGDLKEGLPEKSEGQ